MLRRLLLLVGVVAALTASVSAQAATTVQTIQFTATVTLCNGDQVNLAGPLLITTSTTTTPSGGVITAFHAQPQGVSGIDSTTGTVFRAGGLTRDLTVNSPPGGFTETFVNQFHLQATGGAQSYLVTELFHITVTPAGTVSVTFDNFSSTC
jgi:hypothetical protein